MRVARFGLEVAKIANEKFSRKTLSTVRCIAFRVPRGDIGCTDSHLSRDWMHLAPR
jgi:hypothetical protein